MHIGNHRRVLGVQVWVSVAEVQGPPTRCGAVAFRAMLAYVHSHSHYVVTLALVSKGTCGASVCWL